MKAAVADRGPLGDKTPIHSEQHDILYSQARLLANKRRIHGPWFNVDPFTPNVDEPSYLDSYTPEEPSRCLPQNESFLMCEEFHSDEPLDSMEMCVGDFFTYLFSDAWSKGCSVRVMEGRLLEQILIGLYRLETERRAVRHTTYALARNERYKRTNIKQTRDEKDKITETLMLNFSYFAHLTKRRPNTQSEGPFEYLHRMQWQEEPEIKPKKKSKRKKKLTGAGRQGCSHGRLHGLLQKHMTSIFFIAKLRRRNQVGQPTEDIPVETKKLDEYVCTAVPSLKLEIHGATSRQDTILSVAKSVSKLQDIYQSSSNPDASLKFHRPISKTELCTSLGIKTTSPDTTPSKQRRGSDNDHGIKTYKRLDATTEEFYFDPEDVASPSTPVAVKPVVTIHTHADSGEELYLSDTKQLPKNNPVRGKLMSKVLLQQKRKVLDETRNQRKDDLLNKIEKLKSARIPLSRLSPLDQGRIKADFAKHDHIRMPDAVPSFFEMIKLLKEDDLFRHAMRQKANTIYQRYYMTRCNYKASVMYHPDEIPEIIRRCRSNWGPTIPHDQADGTQRGSWNGLSSVTETVNTDVGTDFPFPFGGMSMQQLILQGKYSDELINGTDENGKRLSLGRKSSNKFSTEFINSPDTNGKRLSLGRKMSKKLLVSITKTPSRVVAKKTKEGETSPNKVATAREDSPDSPVGEHSASSIFDTSKLNINHSTDRLVRMHRAQDEARMHRAQDEARMHRAQDEVNGEGSGHKQGKRRHTFMSEKRLLMRRSTDFKGSVHRGTLTSTIHVKAKGSDRQAASFSCMPEHPLENTVVPEDEVNHEPVVDNTPPMIVGKLRHFAYLDATPQVPRVPSRFVKYKHSLRNTDYDIFQLQLERALDHFVVRREIVMSSMYSHHNSSTSVTFTKSACFACEHAH